MRSHQTSASLAMWAMLLLYAAARPLQFVQTSHPVLVAALHIIPPAIFAGIHSMLSYGWRGSAAFAAFCVGTGAFVETFSLRTGFPFGRYFFTSAMGPKLFHLPVLLAFAYWGIGYVAWALSLSILNPAGKPLQQSRLIGVPLLAAFIMLAWDLAMEAVWADVGKAWVWLDGGPYFGVPISNFIGWYVTALFSYQAFAIFLARAMAIRTDQNWRLPIAFYAVCALGNAPLAIPLPSVTHLPDLFVDATGRSWQTASILRAGALVSLLLMLPLAAIAYRRRSPPTAAAEQSD